MCLESVKVGSNHARARLGNLQLRKIGSSWKKQLTTTCTTRTTEKQGFMTHSGFTRRVTMPQGLKALLFVVSVVSLCFELRFQGSLVWLRDLQG